MADPITKAETTTTPGRFIVTTRDIHLVADASQARGGPGQGWGAAELALASLATCGLALVTEAARARGDALGWAAMETTYAVDPADRTRFSRLALHLRLAGVSAAAADPLLRAFTDVCPIWNTLARTTPHEATVEVVDAMLRAA